MNIDACLNEFIQTLYTRCDTCAYLDTDMRAYIHKFVKLLRNLTYL